jgi:hypothetical protein
MESLTDQGQHYDTLEHEHQGILSNKDRGLVALFYITIPYCSLGLIVHA